MRPRKRIPAHPGVILQEEYLIPLGVTQVAFAAHIGVPVQRVNEIVPYPNHDLARSRPHRHIRRLPQAG